MSSSNSLIELVVDQTSADNYLRNQAELNFNKIVDENPTKIACELTRACELDTPYSIEVKQSCLLHLKRLVPKYWSAGFELFIGPPIDQQTKALIRESLLLFATSSTSSKIRSGSSYVIVQIAAVDFPDEWPDLLEKLYACATENKSTVSVVGGLSVLNDLFDDLISESQFWEGGVGKNLISFIEYLLQQPKMSPEIKISALKLHLTVLDTLLSAEAFQLDERKQSVISHVKFLYHLLLSLAEDLIKISSSSESIELVQLSFRSFLYRVISKVLSGFRRHIPSLEISNVVHVLCLDVYLGAKAVKFILVDKLDSDLIVKTEDLDVPDAYVSQYLVNLFDALSAAQDCCSLSQILEPGQLKGFTMALSACAQYPKETIDDYVGDFNLFVTNETGLSSLTTIRDSIKDFVSELNEKDKLVLFELLKSQLQLKTGCWFELEATLFISEGLFMDQDSSMTGTLVSMEPFLDLLRSYISTGNAEQIHPLLVTRIFLLIPKVLASFAANDMTGCFWVEWIERIFDICAVRTDHELVLASALISISLWKNLEQFDLTKLGPQIQSFILKTSNFLLDDSDEDTLPVLLEAMSVAISIDGNRIFLAEIDGRLTIVELFLRVCFKDPGNVQVSIDSGECLNLLLHNIGLEHFLDVCQKLISYLVGIITTSLLQDTVPYSPQLDLTLELLGYIIEASPCPKLPQDIFQFVFPVLKDLILRADDDQILQSAGELFNKLMQNNESLFIKYTDPDTSQTGLDILLAIASKFLSLELNDRAAMNCGLIVITIFERFQTCLSNDFFFQLLEATVRRVAVAKEVLTIENLILVFCKLALTTSTSSLIDALTSMKVFDSLKCPKNGLETVLPIWFESFEVTRGVEKIQQNIYALGKIFSLGDSRVESIEVDGDLIPYDGDLIITRSMAKSMPQKFTRISAPHKILKLLISELRFQSQQPDSNDYVICEDDEDNTEDGWEDMDTMGIPNYEKLKAYVDSDEEHSDQDSDKGIKETLVQFFKECITKNLANFQVYYEMLDDEEKSALSENVIFA